ncbi:hypothetical protein BDN72DRAFT_965632 [Pluteus cervinus]|uniref:Uncharacterized protein n=1 Tax=Pluteus cervinus TaxID=181527 RepID=A0ACD3A4N0_9AGAR|nr:hypothetical protein BDN72DRAFT_965632 [Pluteus cervinus]
MSFSQTPNDTTFAAPIQPDVPSESQSDYTAQPHGTLNDPEEGTFGDTILLFLSALHFVLWVSLNVTSSCLEFVEALLAGKRGGARTNCYGDANPGIYYQNHGPHYRYDEGSDGQIVFLSGYTPSPRHSVIPPQPSMFQPVPLPFIMPPRTHGRPPPGGRMCN